MSAWLTQAVLLLAGGVVGITGDPQVLRERCGAGSLSSCTELSMCYALGAGVEKDLKQAATIATRACDGGETLACGIVALGESESKALGLFLDACAQGGPPIACMMAESTMGKGVDLADARPEAEARYQAACDKTGGAPCRALGALLAKGSSEHRNPERAVAVLTKGCGDGHPSSCMAAGFLLALGNGVPRDIARALTLVADGCDKHDALACKVIAALKARGALTEHAKAVAISESACEQGDAAGCVELGKTLLFFEGKGGEESKGRAAAIFKKLCAAKFIDGCAGQAALREDKTNDASLASAACTAGSAFGCAVESWLDFENPGALLTPDERQALADRGCDGGEALGCFVSALPHLTGDGVAPDPAFAAAKAVRACDLGLAYACDLFASMLVAGVGAPKDIERARAKMERGCSLRNEAPCPMDFDRRSGLFGARNAKEDPASSSVVMAFESKPAGAEVLVDGHRLCETPCRKRVSPGPHSLVARRDLHVWVARTFTAVAGGTVSVSLPPNSGWLSVETTPPRLAIRVDGEGSTSNTKALELPAGRGEVMIADSCFLPQTVAVTLRVGERKTLRLRAEPYLARLKVHADDERGDALTARVTVDGVPVGRTGEILEVPRCSQKMTVKAGKLRVERTISLREDGVNVVQVKPEDGGMPIGMVRVSGGDYEIPTSEIRSDGQRKLRKEVFPEFLLDATEVTMSSYASCVRAGHCTPPDSFCNWARRERAKHPVNCVDWSQAAAYCAWMGKRLPSEAEWSWAAHGADRRTSYPWGNELQDERLCWKRHLLDPTGSTCEVGAFPAGRSPEGLYDMRGNVEEWTSSWKAGGDPAAPHRAIGQGAGTDRVVVFWNVMGGRPPLERSANVGFRCAK